MNRSIKALGMRVAMGAALATVSASPAFAITLDDIYASFNGYVIEDFTYENVDSQGAVGVGGNATTTNFTYNALGTHSIGAAIGGDLNHGPGNIVGDLEADTNANVQQLNVSGTVRVGGNFTGTNGSISGDLEVEGSTTLTGFGVTGTASTQTYTPTFDHAEIASVLSAGSVGYSMLSNTGGSIDDAFGNVTFNTVAGDNVFSIAASDLSAKNINFSGAGSTAIVNVLGTGGVDALTLQNKGFSPGALGATNILFNLVDVESLLLSGIGFKGSILAPTAVTQFFNGHIDGGLFVRSLDDAGMGNGGELHSFAFNGGGGAGTPVPEPGTLLLAGTGLGWLARRRRQNA